MRMKFEKNQELAWIEKEQKINSNFKVRLI